MKKSFFSADTANFSILTPCSIHSVVVFFWYLFMKLYAALERGTTNVFLINTGAIKLYHILDGSLYSFGDVMPIHAILWFCEGIIATQIDFEKKIPRC